MTELDIKELETKILFYLADRQGKWCCWFRLNNDYGDNCIGNAFPHVPLTKIFKVCKKLIKKGLSGGCACGCRGDLEITDKGLKIIGRDRTEIYGGY